jgi:[acyl-carrier-protein] S-malonyltransferase
VATGALTFEDALRLVRVRGEVMKAAGERNRGGMAAILGLTIEKVEALCGEISDSQVWVANDNCPGQVVISGEEQALRRAQEHFTVHGARKFVRLAVSIAAHSPLMESAQEDFQLALQKTPIQDPRFPLIGNTEARVLRSAGEIRQELNAQLTSRVRWTQSMRLLLDLGAELIFELGPGSVLRKLMRRIDPSASIMALDSPASFAQIDPAGAS